MRILKLLKNEYIYSVITKMITVVMSLCQSILVARYLGSAIQGTNSYILSVVSIGAIIVTFGMHQAYPYFRKKNGKEAFFDDFITIVLLIFLMYFICSALIAILFVPTVELKAAVLLIPLYGYDRIINYIFLVEEPNKRNTVWTIISFMDILFVIALMFFWDRSVYSGIAILAFAAIAKSIVYSFMLEVHRHFRIRKSIFSLCLSLLKIGFFPMIALLMTTLNYKIDILMLKASPIITASQIGVYSVGMSFADKIVIIPDTLKGVLVSKLSKGADEHEVAKVSRLCFWVTLFVCAVFLILGEPMIDLLYGVDYQGAYSVLMLCAFGSLFVGYFKLIAQYNIVNRKQIRNVVLLSFSIVINIILNYILIPRFELKGAAIASGVGYFLSGWIFIIWFARSNRIRLSEMFLIQKQDIFKLIKKKGV